MCRLRSTQHAQKRKHYIVKPKCVHHIQVKITKHKSDKKETRKRRQNMNWY